MSVEIIKPMSEINRETFEQPVELTPETVMYYSHHAKKLFGTARGKAKKFLEKGCIQYDHEFQCFFCNPMPPYNKSRYKIEKQKVGFECSCQACQTKIKKGTYHPDKEDQVACCHILSVFLWLKINNHNKRDERSKKSS